MSRYTIELRGVAQLFSREEIESWFKDYELTDYLTQEQIDTINEHGLWSKDKLASKIVNHYWMCEIGFETPALFRHYAKQRMQELMEEYLPLIYTSAIEFDPLVNVDFTEEFTQENTGTSNGNGLSIVSDTPQGQVNKTSILQGQYATSTNGNESTATSEDNSHYLRRTKGNSGVSATAQRMIQQTRDLIRATDREIIEKLNDLFMVIY